jgi:hypothetical protein
MGKMDFTPFLTAKMCNPWSHFSNSSHHAHGGFVTSLEGRLCLNPLHLLYQKQRDAAAAMSCILWWDSKRCNWLWCRYQRSFLQLSWLGLGD